MCGNSGVEDLVRQFRKAVEEEIRLDPTQPFPALYLKVRSKFTSKLPFDAKLLFLSEIPPYDSLATGMYRVRRQYIPAAPLTQAGLDVSSDWFMMHSSEETIVKDDILHSDGLRVLLFPSDESLRIFMFSEPAPLYQGRWLRSLLLSERSQQYWVWGRHHR